jgi:hypothetical protein
MQYLWEKFNIKTFPAHSVIFVDGIFQPDISDCEKCTVRMLDNITEIVADSPDDLPVHIVSLGEITGNRKIFLKIFSENIHVFLTAKNEFHVPAFLTVFIENTGKNSTFTGSLVLQNHSDLKLDIGASHLAPNACVFVKTRVLAHQNSTTDLHATANIVADCPGCESDISFTAMCAPDIKSIKMSPNQKIASIPESAEHSAAIYRGTKLQIEFLSAAGLDAQQIKQTLEEAFLN